MLGADDLIVARIEVQHGVVAWLGLRDPLDPDPPLRHLVTSSERGSVAWLSRIRAAGSTSLGSGRR
jgi:hypothetical protein